MKELSAQELAVKHGDRMYNMGEKQGRDIVLYRLINESIESNFSKPADFWNWSNKELKGDK
ncbi:MAG: hypothetical protein IIB83_08375 [Bacteroidetes bacterium]|nr:hypothetical protein [Bacteroidota bacterium]